MSVFSITCLLLILFDVMSLHSATKTEKNNGKKSSFLAQTRNKLSLSSTQKTENKNGENPSSLTRTRGKSSQNGAPKTKNKDGENPSSPIQTGSNLSLNDAAMRENKDGENLSSATRTRSESSQNGVITTENKDGENRSSFTRTRSESSQNGALKTENMNGNKSPFLTRNRNKLSPNGAAKMENKDGEKPSFLTRTKNKLSLNGAVKTENKNGGKPSFLSRARSSLSENGALTTEKNDEEESSPLNRTRSRSFCCWSKKHRRNCNGDIPFVKKELLPSKTLEALGGYRSPTYDEIFNADDFSSQPSFSDDDIEEKREKEICQDTCLRIHGYFAYIEGDDTLIPVANGYIAERPDGTYACYCYLSEEATELSRTAELDIRTYQASKKGADWDAKKYLKSKGLRHVSYDDIGKTLRKSFQTHNVPLNMYSAWVRNKKLQRGNSPLPNGRPGRKPRSKPPIPR